MTYPNTDVKYSRASISNQFFPRCAYRIARVHVRHCNRRRSTFSTLLIPYSVLQLPDHFRPRGLPGANLHAPPNPTRGPQPAALTLPLPTYVRTHVRHAFILISSYLSIGLISYAHISLSSYRAMRIQLFISRCGVLLRSCRSDCEIRQGYSMEDGPVKTAPLTRELTVGH